MSSAKISPGARAPQRRRGQQRVAELLKAAAAVFAEKGFGATTMTEIAARAKAPIGSLYQFFPNKDVLGAALMRRYLELAVEALTKIEGKAKTLTDAALADALLNVFVDLKRERAAAISMLDALPGQASGVGDFRATMLHHLGGILKIRLPGLAPTRAAAMALAVLQQMKAAAALEGHADAKTVAATLRELRAMLALYLEQKR